MRPVPRRPIARLAVLATALVGLVLAPAGMGTARGDDSPVEDGALARATDAPPAQRIARAEVAAPALFLGSLPLRRLDVVARHDPTLRGPAVAGDPLANALPRPPLPRTGIELEAWTRPDASRDESSSFGRFIAPETPAPVSPALIALETERSQLLQTLRLDALPSGACHSDVFECRPRAADPRREALFSLGSYYFYRELRRYFRSELKDQFEEDPTLSQDEYQARRNLIGQLGRGGNPEDLIIEERAAEIRNEFLESSPDDPEREMPVLQWGPLVLDDRGGVNLDVTKLPEDRKLDRFDLELAPGEDAYAKRAGGSVLFPGDRYRISSKVKLNPDLREVGRDWGEAFGKLSASVEVDWNAPVLERRSFTTELGGSIDAEGEYGLYLNLIIYTK